jgi:hypothetical protein
MHSWALLLSTGILLGMAIPGSQKVSAHCADKIPVVTMTFPSDGVSIQKACYPDFGNLCLVDTFYRDTLKAELVAKYQASQHVIYGYVDSVRNYYTYDTIYRNNQLDYIDTFSTEDIGISIHSELKGAMPVQKLALMEKWLAIPNLPFAYTYTGVLDTPFVAFFNTYATPPEMGLGPVDGCFFEPTVFYILNDRIHKKGASGSRMPGVSVSLDDFFAAVGRAKVTAPPIRNHSGIRPRSKGLALTPGPGPYRIFLYDLAGHRLPGFPIRNSETWSGSGFLPMGWYFLRLVGEGWSSTREVFFPGGTGMAETLGISAKTRNQ